MKILHLDGASEDFGGVLSVLRNVAEASRPLGWSHAVWVNEAYVEKRSPSLDYRRSQRIVSDSPSHIEILLQAVRAASELKRLLVQESFEILHAHSRGALLAGSIVSARLRRPLVFTNHNYARHRGLYRWAARRPRMFTVLLTPNMGRYYGLEIQPPPLRVISSCCADRFFTEPLVNAERWKPGGRPVRFVGSGTLFRWKNWHLVAEAFSRLTEAERQQVHFTLLGPTPDAPGPRAYERELHQLIKARGLERQFTLAGPTASMPEALREAGWMLHPATNEPCGVALIEALALGLPAIVADSAGPADIVQHERTGLKFAPDDADDLAAQVRRVLRGEANPSPPEQIRETVRARSATGVLPAYQALYRDVLAAGSGGVK